jgi:hypothetical protein
MSNSSQIQLDLLETFWKSKQPEIIKLIETIVDAKLQANQVHRTVKTATQGLHQLGYEDYSYILDKLPVWYREEKLDHRRVLQKIIKDLYFTKEQKANQIIYIPPGSYDVMYVHKDGNWKSIKLSDGLTSVIKRANDVLQHYFNSDHEKDFIRDIGGKRKFESLQLFTNQIDNLEIYIEAQKLLFKETEHTILSNQHTVHATTFQLPEERKL